MNSHLLSPYHLSLTRATQFLSVHSATLSSTIPSLTPRRQLNRNLPSMHLRRTSSRRVLHLIHRRTLRLVHLVHHMPISCQLGNRVGGSGAATTTATIQDECQKHHDNDDKRHNDRNRGGSTTMLTGLWCRCGTTDSGRGITDSRRLVTGREVGALPYDHDGRSPDAPIRDEGGGSRCGEQLRAAPEQVEAAGACWI